MEKIRAQILLDYDMYSKLVTLKDKIGAKSVSVLMNRILFEAFRAREELEKKDRVIDNLNNMVTNLGTQLENYKRLVHEQENRKDVKTGKSKEKNIS